MELSLQDISTIQRMLGKIEGVAYLADKNIADALFDILEIMDGIFDKEDKPCD